MFGRKPRQHCTHCSGLEKDCSSEGDSNGSSSSSPNEPLPKIPNLIVESFSLPIIHSPALLLRPTDEDERFMDASSDPLRDPIPSKNSSSLADFVSSVDSLSPEHSPADLSQWKRQLLPTSFLLVLQFLEAF